MRVNLPVQEICFYTGIIKNHAATLKAGVADIKADGKVVRQLKDELEGERKDEISSRGKKEELACYYDKKAFSAGMIECSIKRYSKACEKFLHWETNFPFHSRTKRRMHPAARQVF